MYGKARRYAGRGVPLGRKKILVVDDNAINRMVAGSILESNYDVLQAENGQEALQLLWKHGEEIALVLLDLMMPVMDGYEFLRVRKEDPALTSVPVIVTTSNDSDAEEVRCLADGASDFVAKPYHPEVVRHRVASIINLRESSAMLNMLEFDQLTGLYSREFFYQHAARLLEQFPDQRFDLLCSDVENFKLVNDRHGVPAGDAVLRYLADKYRNFLGPNDICARIGPDVFAFLLAHREDFSRDDFVQAAWGGFADSPAPNLTVKFGLYEDVNRSIPVSSMCDRALMAMKRIKNQYGKFLSRYDDSLRLTLLKEQRILDSMEQALAERQFMVYFQPKHDIVTGGVSGAEALVRWIHPKLGFMSPGEFIPLFERNGFITKVDFYVWEQVCAALRDWKERGLPVVPVSANISRADFNTPDLAQKIRALVDEYGVDHRLLHLEVTESAYTDNPQHIIDVVSDLRAAGFKIEMDDFGSGYSSLNMLSELPIDVLKLDMRFMRQGDESMRKTSILSFVISLSKWLELEAIAEGVETAEQVETLRSMGCRYVQGYYFAKPMPVDQFEEYLGQVGPAALRQEEEPAAAAPETDPEEERRELVLVVEDAEISRDILRAFLEPRYRMAEACNGREAMEYLEANRGAVSAILLDLMMPVMDGFQVLGALRADEEFSRIPVIITSEGEGDGEVRALRLGACDFVSKPYRQEVLLHRLGYAIDSAELHRYRESGAPAAE